jgi:hypothetical protein
MHIDRLAQRQLGIALQDVDDRLRGAGRLLLT